MREGGEALHQGRARCTARTALTQACTAAHAQSISAAREPTDMAAEMNNRPFCFLLFLACPRTCTRQGRLARQLSISNDPCGSYTERSTAISEKGIVWPCPPNQAPGFQSPHTLRGSFPVLRRGLVECKGSGPTPRRKEVFVGSITPRCMWSLTV